MEPALDIVGRLAVAALQGCALGQQAKDQQGVVELVGVPDARPGIASFLNYGVGVQGAKLAASSGRARRSDTARARRSSRGALSRKA